MLKNKLSAKTDEEIMVLIRKGEERAFTELYGRYSKLLVRYLYRMLWQDESKAQDLLHDLFLKIIEKPESFDPSRKFSTWIYSVAHNMCKNEYRKQAFRAQAVDDINRSEIVEARIDEQIDHKQFAVVLHRSMQAWSEEDRSLFTLRHELEMTFSDIASVLGCPEGTAKSRWFYLRKNLAEQLQEFQSLIK